MLWQSREISPEGKWKVSDELHPVTQWNNICLGLPACTFDVSLSSPRTGRGEVVDYDGKLFPEKYWWVKGNFTNFRWTLSQLSWKILFPVCGANSPIYHKSALHKPFDKGEFEAAVETGCAQALCPYADTREHNGAGGVQQWGRTRAQCYCDASWFGPTK